MCFGVLENRGYPVLPAHWSAYPPHNRTDFCLPFHSQHWTCSGHCGVCEILTETAASLPTSLALTSQLRLRTQAWRTMLKSWGWLGCWWLTYLIEVSLSWLIYPGCPAASDRQPCPQEGKENQLVRKQATYYLILMQIWNRKLNLFSYKNKWLVELYLSEDFNVSWIG